MAGPDAPLAQLRQRVHRPPVPRSGKKKHLRFDSASNAGPSNADWIEETLRLFRIRRSATAAGSSTTVLAQTVWDTPTEYPETAVPGLGITTFAKHLAMRACARAASPSNQTGAAAAQS